MIINSFMCFIELFNNKKGYSSFQIDKNCIKNPKTTIMIRQINSFFKE